MASRTIARVATAELTTRQVALFAVLDALTLLAALWVALALQAL